MIDTRALHGPGGPRAGPGRARAGPGLKHEHGKTGRAGPGLSEARAGPGRALSLIVQQ